MIHKYALQTVHINIPALKDTEEIFWSFLIDHEFEAKCDILITGTAYAVYTSGEGIVCDECLVTQVSTLHTVHLVSVGISPEREARVALGGMLQPSVRPHDKVTITPLSGSSKCGCPDF